MTQARNRLPNQQVHWRTLCDSSGARILTVTSKRRRLGVIIDGTCNDGRIIAILTNDRNLGTFATVRAAANAMVAAL
jgi:hypothetical protein